MLSIRACSAHGSFLLVWWGSGRGMWGAGTAAFSLLSWEPKLGVMKAALVLTSARENMEVMQGVDP